MNSPSFKAYARRIMTAPLLSADEERTLVERMTEGDDRARNALIEAHMRIPLAMATRRTTRGDRVEDLLQEGALGMERGLRRFDPARGSRVGPWLAIHAKEAMDDMVLRDASLVRIMNTEENKRVFRRLPDAMRNCVDLTRSAALDVARVAGSTEEAVFSIWLRVSGHVDMDALSEDEAGQTRVVDAGLRTAIESVEDADDMRRRRMLVMKALDCLDMRERDIFTRRHLVDTPVGYLELAADNATSRERARQIQDIAFRKVQRRVQELEASG